MNSKYFFIGLFILLISNLVYPMQLNKNLSSSDFSTFDKKICVEIFYSPTCPHCKLFRQYIATLSKEHPNLEVKEYAVVSNLPLLQALDEYYLVPDEYFGAVPQVFMADHVFLGSSSEELNEFKSVLLDLEKTNKGYMCPSDKISSLNTSVDTLMKSFKNFSLPVLIFAALVDSVNPCALAGIIFFISYITAIGKKGKALLIVGFFYTLGLFLAYLFLGLFFNNIIDYASSFSSILVNILYPITAIVSLIFSILSFRDYRKIKEGELHDMDLKLPDWAKKLIRKLTYFFMNLTNISAIAFVVGFVISFVEFLCTGQIYLPTILYFQSIPGFQAQALFFLTIYNLIFVFPVVLVFVLAYTGTSVVVFKEFLEKNAPRVKIAIGIFFLVLFAIMLYLSLRNLGLVV